MPFARPLRRWDHRTIEKLQTRTLKARLAGWIALTGDDDVYWKPRVNHTSCMRKPEYAADLTLPRTLRVLRKEIAHERRVECEEEEDGGP